MFQTGQLIDQLKYPAARELDPKKDFPKGTFDFKGPKAEA